MYCMNNSEILLDPFLLLFCYPQKEKSLINRLFGGIFRTRGGGLEIIAKDYGVCVIATSQLNRSVETRGGSKTHTLSNLRDSGAIEQDADKVILITRLSYYGFSEDEEGNSLEEIVKLIVAKNQNGRLGEIKLILDANLTTFSNFNVYNRDFCFLKTE